MSESNVVEDLSQCDLERDDARVVTWQSPRGGTVDVCLSCERARMGRWPRDRWGDEYCTASRGLHEGSCDLCSEVTR